MDLQKANKKIAKILDAALAEHRNFNYRDAIEKYKEILRIIPNHSDALHLLGVAYYQLDKSELAIKYVKKAIEENDKNPKYYDALGMILANQNLKIKSVRDVSEYVESFFRSSDSNREENHVERLLLAEEAYKKSIDIEPENHLNYFNLGALQRVLNKPFDAINNFLKALSISKHNKEIYDELGLTYFDIGEFDKSVESFNKALSIDNKYYKAISDCALSLLAKGEFKDGWNAYELRSRVLDRDADKIDALKNIPLFEGGLLESTDPLIILPEQGIGDEIMFAGLIPDLARLYRGKITLVCTNRLVPIFERTFNNIEVYGLKRFKTYKKQKKLFIGSLPKYLRNAESDFISSNRYLVNNKENEKYFRKKHDKKGLKIGISWRSGNPVEGIKRSIDLSHLEKIFVQKDCSFFNLQYGDMSKEIKELTDKFGVDLIDEEDIDPLTDLDSFFAFVSSLDLIITVDNSTAHIAGSLGIPTWVMLPFNCEWRWLRDRSDSLWYKSLRLYRQQEIGNWDNVIDEIASDLKKRDIQPRCISSEENNNRPDNNISVGDRSKPKDIEKASKKVKQKKIAFINDTSAWYHWGCTATSSAIRKRISECGFGGIYVPINFTYNFKQFPQKAPQFDDELFFKEAFRANIDLYNAINSSDALVINGEGSIHHLSPVSMALLYIAYAAKKFMGKTVQVINHSPYPDNCREPQENFAFQLYREIYNQLDFIAIREHISHKLMTSYGTNAELSFDCLPITVMEDYKPQRLDTEKNIVIAGSVSFSKEKIFDLSKLMQHYSQKGYRIKVLHGAKAFPAQDDIAFIQELQELDYKKYEIVNAQTLTEWLDCINSASVFVSGRFHHSLASIYLETPCVMMESNTLKNVAIAESFGLPKPIQFISETFFEDLLERTDKALISDPVDSELRRNLLARSEVNFKALKGL